MWGEAIALQIENKKAHAEIINLVKGAGVWDKVSKLDTNKLMKEQFDDKFMAPRERELSSRLGKLPARVEQSVREIITEDEFEGMQKWLSRLKESKTFNADKKEKLQDVLRDWIDEDMDSDWDIEK